MAEEVKSIFDGIEVSRRTFTKATAALGAFAAFGGYPTKHFDRLIETAGAQEEPEEKTVHTFCGICSANCAVKARVKDDVLQELGGNSEDQISGGVLCVKGYAGRNLLYDPDRLKYPMKRTNPNKGVGEDPKWVRITWDEAFDLVAGKLKEIKDRDGPQAIAVVSRPKTWQKHFAKSIGTPNLIAHNNTCYITHEIVWRATVTGTGRPWTTDYSKSKFILSFGWDQPGKAKNVQARDFIEAKRNGARVVVLDPRFSVTASKADEWIPIKPGTDLAFTLAMINVIVNEELYDKEFVENYTSGLDKLDDFIQEYTPEWASGITDIPADTIARVAREFATTRPAVVATHKRDAGGPNYANSWRLSHAEVILNALVGAIDREGGVIFERKPKLPNFGEYFGIPSYPESVKGERIDGLEKFPILYKTGKASFPTFVEGVLEERPYPIKAALFWKYNVLAFTDTSKLIEALKKLEFIAVIDILPTEIIEMADVILPDRTYLEGSGVGVRTYFAKYPQVAIKQPVVKPLYETKGTSSILIEIGRRMGLDEYFPEGASGKSWNEGQLNALGTSFEEMKESPTGIWSDKKPFVPKEEFGTPSKKIELYSQVFEENGYDPLPAWAPKRDLPSNEYPYYLIVTRKPFEKMTQSQNDPILREIYPENRALMNRTTAQSLGIRNGEYVYVESRAGKIRVKAELTEGIRPDCVCVDHGFGHWSKELSVAYGIGGNDGDLIPLVTLDEALERKDPSLGACMSDVCVKVYT